MTDAVPRKVEVVQVIKITAARGDGKSTIMREVAQFWDFDGNLLAENDLYAGGKDMVDSSKRAAVDLRVRPPQYDPYYQPTGVITPEVKKSEKRDDIDILSILRQRAPKHTQIVKAKKMNGDPTMFVVADFGLDIPARDDNGSWYEAYVSRFTCGEREIACTTDRFLVEAAKNPVEFRRVEEAPFIEALGIDPTSFTPYEIFSS